MIICFWHIFSSAHCAQSPGCDTYLQLWSVSTSVVQGASADDAAAATVSLLLSDGHGDVRLLCARDVASELDAKLGDKSQQPQQRRVVEHGRQQGALCGAGCERRLH